MPSSPAESANSTKTQDARHLRVDPWRVFWAIAFGVGALQAIGARFDMDPDGISYLNISDLYLAGNWSDASNAYWSPGYPALIALFRKVFRPTLMSEVVAIHALNFLLFIASAAAFRFFLRQLAARQLQAHPEKSDHQVITFREPWIVASLGALFLWGALHMTSIGYLTPDLMLAAIIYLAAGLLVRARAGASSAALFALSGVLLGAAYLTKAVMFPIGCIVVCTCAMRLGSTRMWLTRTAYAAFGFLVVSTPQLIAASQIDGRLSYGAVGRIAYAGKVNWYTRWWVGKPDGSGTPVHPIRQIHSSPDAYEFSSGIPGSSYPFWDTPAYWLEGIQPRFSLREQLPVVAAMLGDYAKWMWPLLLAIGCLVIVAGGIRNIRPAYPFYPALLAFLLYSLVHAEPRFFAAWAVVLFASVLAGLSLRLDRFRLASGAACVASAILIVPVLRELPQRTLQAAGLLTGHTHGHDQWLIAQELKRLGLKPGDRVASIGRAFDGYWARLAQLQIAMEVNEWDAPSFWASSDATRTAVLRKFGAHGAQAVIVNQVEPAALDSSWVPIGAGYYALMLQEPGLQ